MVAGGSMGSNGLGTTVGHVRVLVGLGYDAEMGDMSALHGEKRKR